MNSNEIHFFNKTKQNGENQQQKDVHGVHKTNKLTEQYYDENYVFCNKLNCTFLYIS